MYLNRSLLYSENSRAFGSKKSRSIETLYIIVTGQGELHGEAVDALLQVCHLGAHLLVFVNEGLELLQQLARAPLLRQNCQLHSLVDESRHLLEVLLHEVARGEGGGPEADARRPQRRLVSGARVLIGRNANQLQKAFHSSPVNVERPEVHEAKVHVGAPRDHVHTVSDKLLAQGLTVGDHLRATKRALGPRSRSHTCKTPHLFLVRHERRLHRLFQTHSDRRNGVVVRTALQTGEHSLVDRPLQVVHFCLAVGLHASNALAEEDHAWKEEVEGLGGGRGDKIEVTAAAAYQICRRATSCEWWSSRHLRTRRGWV